MDGYEWLLDDDLFFREEEDDDVPGIQQQSNRTQGR